MKKLYCVIVVAATATTAWGQYTGAWNNTWDFENGTQGWTITQNSTGGGSYYAGGGSGPTLADGSASGYGSGSFYLPDKSYARINISDFTSKQLGANGTTFSGKEGFILQADAYVPNLLPLTGFPSSHPGNGLQLAGVGVEGTNIALYAEGKTNSNGLTVRDYGWDNSGRNLDNVMNERTTPAGATVTPYAEWWDDVVTYQIDYGFTTPGKWTAWAYLPWNNQIGAPGWYKMSAGNYSVHPNGSAATFLQLGGSNSWTQAQFDNVKLAYTPEPATLSFLAVSGLFLMRRRRA